MTIGILAAMTVEAEAIRQEMQVSGSKTLGGTSFTEGRWQGKDIVLAVCGIGKVSAAMTAQTLILTYAPGLLVNTGVAGSVSPQAVLLDVVLARDVVQHDVDTSALGDPVGWISALSRIDIPCAGEGLLEVLEGLAAGADGIHLARVASGDQFIADPAQSAAIAQRFGAVAVDMESGSIGQVCFVNATPCCIIRTISDGADGMEYQAFVQKAAEKSIDVLRRLLDRV